MRTTRRLELAYVSTLAMLAIGCDLGQHTDRVTKSEPASLVMPDDSPTPGQSQSRAESAERNESAQSDDVAVLPAKPPEENQRDELPDLIERIERSIVRIDVNTASGSIIGSGFIVSQGVVVTNHHVIEDGIRARVVFLDGKSMDVAGLLSDDAEHDIAVLKLVSESGIAPLALVNDLPRKGELTVAFGAPEGLAFSVTEGIVSAVRTDEPVKGRIYPGTWIQTTAPLSHGNSGGPLVNLRGEVIGVNTRGLTDGQNLNFAVSSLHIREALNRSKGAAVKPLSPTLANATTKSANVPELGEATAVLGRLREHLFGELGGIELHESELARYANELKRAMLSADTQRESEIRAAIRGRIQTAKQLVARPSALPRLNVTQLHAGEVGVMPGTAIRIMQVLSKDEGKCLALPLTPLSRGMIRLCGLDLTSVVDGQELNVPGDLVFGVLGTRTYSTVSGGSNTVFEVVCLTNLTALREEIAKRLVTTAPEPEFSEDEQDQLAAARRVVELQQRERRATSDLRLAKSTITSGRVEFGKGLLRRVIEMYPNTPAAVEAESLLKGL